MNESKLILSECREAMAKMEANSVDAIVTDAPYGLAFMGADFDTFHAEGKSDNLAFQESMIPIFAEALRIAKPGAHLLAFGGTRTYHRLACAIEDAGWEIKDCIFWCHGQGFPKGQNVSKQVEALLKTGKTNSRSLRKVEKVFAPETDAAKAWEGWNTQLKPACEPIVVARKPLEGTVAANILKYGTGAININACRIPLAADDKLQNGVHHNGKSLDTQNMGWGFKSLDRSPGLGRFPANLIHDGSDEVLALFPNSKGQCGAIKGTEPSKKTNEIYGNYNARLAALPRGDSGSAARFFYCAKASRSERGPFNDHCTVKPLALMRYLVRLVSHKNGIVLDPFMGSGTTGIAALQEGMNFVGIERDPHYYEIASHRINYSSIPSPKPTLSHTPLPTYNKISSHPLTSTQLFLPL